MKAFQISRATHVSIGKEQLADIIAYAYETGANAVIDLYEKE